jgi:hypothetical protein
VLLLAEEEDKVRWKDFHLSGHFHAPLQLLLINCAKNEMIGVNIGVKFP